MVHGLKASITVYLHCLYFRFQRFRVFGPLSSIDLMLTYEADCRHCRSCSIETVEFLDLHAVMRLPDV